MKVHVFVGPTLTDDEVRAHRGDAIVHSPVEHGDLLALDVSAGDVVVIVDGYYHQRAPVRHKEILHLIDQGVRVIGCASMGALRAAELWPCGMVGRGHIFAMYVDGTIDADDEVAVAHLRGQGYEARNVPSVNIRHACAKAAEAGVIDSDTASQVIAAARDLHYTERSWRNVRLALAHRTESAPSDTSDPVSALVEYLQDRPDVADLKRTDALETLDAIDEIVAEANDYDALGHWHNPHVYNWLPEFSGLESPGANGVSDGDVLRYRQVFEADFPARWQDFVLAEAAAALGDSAPPEPARIAAETFRRIGALDLVTSENPFVEIADHDTDELLVRTLVRSYQAPRGVHDVVRGVAACPDTAQVREQICAARKINDTVLWRGKVRLVERLAHQRLRQHLAATWQVADEEAALLAAARDRGIASIDEAVSMIRPYFLLDDARTGNGIAERWSVQ